MGDSHGDRGSQVASRGLIPLKEAAGAPLEQVGGKAQSLGRLMAAGFHIPDGFIVTPRQPVDRDALVTHLTRLGTGPYAVRSSGAAEDSADSSMAGLFLSKLGVDTQSAFDAVSVVRVSGRRMNGESIPVLVQQMIEPICSGVVFTADPITGERNKTIISATRGLADQLVSGRIAGEEWHVVGRKVRLVRRTEGVLDRRLARRVATKANEIADQFGAPQDIEWAWDGRTLWIVQSRPITGLPDEVDWTPPAPGVFHRSLRFGEWLPEPVTPLFESWLLTDMERQLHGYLHELLGQVAPEPHHVVVNGWYFYSLNWLPAPGVALWRNLVSIVPRLPRHWRTAAGMFPQTVRFAGRRYEDYWRNVLMPEYRSVVARAEETVDDLSPVDLVGLIDELTRLAGRYFGSIAVVAGSAYKFEAQLAAFWNKHLRDQVGLSHMTVLQGFDQAAVVGQTPRLESLDWSRPILPPQSLPLATDQLRSQRLAAERRATSLLSTSPRKAAKFQRLLADAQYQMPVREEQISQLGIGWPVMRRAVRRIGETLVNDGVVASADDAFLLTKTEVVAVLETPRDLKPTIEARRADLNRACRLVPPLTVGRVPPIVKVLFSMSGKMQGAEPTPSALVHGTPASPGRATGRVRVIRNASEFESFQPGEILVAPTTAPAWTDLFDRAAAVVTDVGSALAHASILAREYGIPAIVGSGDGTARLRNGQLVIVDGSTGNVEPAEDLESDATGRVTP